MAKSLCAQIERCPSVRTIPPGKGHQKAYKRKNAAAESALQRRRFIVCDPDEIVRKTAGFPVNTLFRVKRKGR